MSQTRKIQKLSGILRVSVIFVTIVSAVLLALTLFDIKPIITPMSETWFEALWNSEQNKLIVTLFIMPVYIAFFTSLYWLQRMFAEFQNGAFFSKETVKCFIWMVWLQVFSFFYDIIWPLTLSKFTEFKGQVTVDIADLIFLLLLAFIAHALKLAKSIQEENQGFI